MAETPPDLLRLVALMHGFRSTQVTYVIAKLGLADHLAAGPLTAAELASRVKVNPENLGRVLRLAASRLPGRCAATSMIQLRQPRSCSGRTITVPGGRCSTR